MAAKAGPSTSIVKTGASAAAAVAAATFFWAGRRKRNESQCGSRSCEPEKTLLTIIDHRRPALGAPLLPDVVVEQESGEVLVLARPASRTCAVLVPGQEPVALARPFNQLPWSSATGLLVYNQLFPQLVRQPGHQLAPGDLLLVAPQD